MRSAYGVMVADAATTSKSLPAKEKAVASDLSAGQSAQKSLDGATAQLDSAVGSMAAEGCTTHAVEGTLDHDSSVFNSAKSALDGDVTALATARQQLNLDSSKSGSPSKYVPASILAAAKTGQTAARTAGTAQEAVQTDESTDVTASQRATSTISSAPLC